MVSSFTKENTKLSKHGDKQTMSGTTETTNASNGIDVDALSYQRLDSQLFFEFMELLRHKGSLFHTILTTNLSDRKFLVDKIVAFYECPVPIYFLTKPRSWVRQDFPPSSTNLLFTAKYIARALFRDVLQVLRSEKFKWKGNHKNITQENMMILQQYVETGKVDFTTCFTPFLGTHGIDYGLHAISFHGFFTTMKSRFSEKEELSLMQWLVCLCFFLIENYCSFSLDTFEVLRNIFNYRPKRPIRTRNTFDEISDDPANFVQNKDHVHQMMHEIRNRVQDTVADAAEHQTPFQIELRNSIVPTIGPSISQWSQK